jgi:hypothetical protein
VIFDSVTSSGVSNEFDINFFWFRLEGVMFGSSKLHSCCLRGMKEA